MIGCHITPLPPLLVVRCRRCYHKVDKSVTFNYTKYDGTSQSRTVTYAGTKEVTAVNGSGGVTGHKFIDYGLTNGFDSLQIIWDRYWDTDKGTLVSLMTHVFCLTQGNKWCTTGTGTGFEFKLNTVRGALNFNSDALILTILRRYFRGYERQAFDNNDLDYLLKLLQPMGVDLYNTLTLRGLSQDTT